MAMYPAIKVQQHLLTGYFGFSLCTVGRGDTLSGIAQEAYGDASLCRRIFAADRNQAQLRVPQGSQF